MMHRLIVAVTAVAMHAADPPRQYTIETIAGTDVGAHDGGGQGAVSRLSGPSAIALGSKGEIYFSEAEGNMVRAVERSGAIRTIAGTGESGSDVDGRPGAETRLRTPHGVAVDSSGAIYIADTFNNVIRKVAPDGISTTLKNFREWRGAVRFDPADGIPSDRLFFPRDVAIDARGNVFIADTGNHAIRKITSQGEASIFAGTGKEGFGGDGGSAVNAQLAAPWGISIDSKGTVYIADTRNGRVRRIDADGTISTVAGGGTYYGDGRPAKETKFSTPTRVAADDRGNLYVVEDFEESQTGRVRKVDANGMTCTVVGKAKASPNCPAAIPFDGRPSDVEVDQSGVIYISDSRSGQIVRIDSSRKLTSVAGMGSDDGVPAKLAHFPNDDESLDPMYARGPYIELDRNGNLYIAQGARLQMIDRTGVVRTIAGSSLDKTGTGSTGGPAKSVVLSDPKGMAISAEGIVFFADTDSVWKMRDGILSLVVRAKPDSVYLHGLALMADGSLLASDIRTNRILKIDTARKVTLVAGNGQQGFGGIPVRRPGPC
jgi:sugar lactone lactonase YvrE